MNKTVRSIFLTRLWAFLNVRTRVGLTWLELLTASGVGLLLVWDGLRGWAGLPLVAPLAVYWFGAGFFAAWSIPLAGVRAIHDALLKPLQVKRAPQKKYLALTIVVSALVVVIGVAGLNWRIAALLALLGLLGGLLFWLIHDRATQHGALDLFTVAGRVPIQNITSDGQIVHHDGSGARVAIITQDRSGFKPALNAVDVADILTKFLATLAQREQGGVPIRLFWLTDYHLGQLDLQSEEEGNAEYLRELRALAESGARRARVIITGIVYPVEIENLARDWLTQLDFKLVPLGAFAAESLVRMIFRRDSFLGQIQEMALKAQGGLPRAAYRGFLPEQLRFDESMHTDQNVIKVSQILTPFPDAREALMRALRSVDGLLTVTLMPWPRATAATEMRGRLLAARVPGLGDRRAVQQLRATLTQLDDRRGLEYLFDSQTFFVTWGHTESEAQRNQNLAAAYLTALDSKPVMGRALDALDAWLPVLATACAANPIARALDALVAPRRLPCQQLLTSQALSVLEREEGSDLYLADARGRILLGRSVDVNKEGLRYVDFRADTGPVLLVSDQGGGKTSTLIVWFILRLQLLNYKIVAVNMKYSSRMQIAVEKLGGIVLHPTDELDEFERHTREALFSERAVIYQPIKGTRPFAIADDPCLGAFMKIFYEEWLPHRDAPAALVIDEIHRLMPKDNPLSANASAVATFVAEAFKDWAERKLVIAAATQTLRDLLGSNLGIALQKFRAAAYFQVGPEDREMLVEKGYAPELIDTLVGGRRPRGFCLFVMPDGFYTTMKILVTPDEKEIIQRLDVEETSDTTPQLAMR